MHKYVIPPHPLSTADRSQTGLRPLEPDALFPVGIVGARGYSGLELARLLLSHPLARLTACFASDPKSFVLGNELFEAGADAVPTLPMSDLDASDLSKRFHTIFLATPAEVSIELAPKLLEKGVNVIDLSGGFRLCAEDYPTWYGFDHGAPSLLKSAHYGMIPFAGPAPKPASSQGALVANPGCYVTSVVLALAPLLKAGVIEQENIVVDAKSGTTGGGKKPAESLLYSEVSGECLPYKVGAHQHYPEIIQGLEAFSGVRISPHFSTSLLPTPRGIISGIYARLKTGKTLLDVQAAYDDAFAGYPLAIHAPIRAGSPKTLSLKQVVGSNRIQIAYATAAEKGGESKLFVYSLIDNLLKGAASQAIENWNRSVDRPAHLGLAKPQSDDASLSTSENQPEYPQ